MARNKKGRNSRFEIPKVVKLSPWFKEPLGTFFSAHFGKVVLYVLTGMSALLIFPFTLRSIIAEALIFLTALWLACKIVKRRRTGTHTLRFCFVISVMFLFGAICPFIVNPGPVYVAVLDTTLTSKVDLLASGGNKFGSVVLISNADIVRKGTSLILSKMFPSTFRLLKRTDRQNGSFYSLPVLKGFIFEASAAGSFPAKKSIYFPSVLFEKGIEMDFAEPKILMPRMTNDFSFQVGAETGPLVGFAYFQYPDTMPWEGVAVQNTQDLSIFDYIALLDQSLEFFATARTEEAINCLNAAAAIVPAQNLEGARLAALRYGVTDLSFRGNIGELQSLPLLNNAYELFLQSQHDPRFSSNDPLMNWVWAVLVSGYDSWTWSTEFLDRVSRLKALPHLENDIAGKDLHTDEIRKTFDGKSYEQIFELLHSTTYSSAELHFIKYLLFGRLITQSLATFQNSTNGVSSLSEIANIGRRIKPAVQFIDLSLERKHELKPDHFMLRTLESLDYLAKELPALPQDASDDDLKRFISLRAKRDPLFQSVSEFIGECETGSLTNGSWNGANVQWWKVKYLLWFANWSSNAAHEIEAVKYPWRKAEPPIFGEYNMRDALSKNGADYFTKDMGGKGQIFVPGLFFLAWYEQTLQMSEAEDLRKEFEAETQMSFERFRLRLYPSTSEAP